MELMVDTTEGKSLAEVAEKLAIEVFLTATESPGHGRRWLVQS
ncbi:hypothetical protein PF010_g28441 [Phytophthora fragariae]|uniref:Uncharacterized protein n=1 Tax=Phytophthora fragariae TaxID=53985 RepID=A0A6A3HDN8_9STRA|nr:hypothetical protein PF011_g27726 [Phytophthora fragariae]KAE9064878.1 hypothetical protein PF010_g28441 [Phytophthora fragariae]KAE9171517.1 hypothetical protein PF004_g27537 [Phytophthora fragariae]